MLSTLDYVIAGLGSLASLVLAGRALHGGVHASRALRERPIALSTITPGPVWVRGVARAPMSPIVSLQGKPCVAREIEAVVAPITKGKTTRYAGIDRQCVMATLEDDGVSCDLELRHVEIEAAQSFELTVREWRRIDPETVARLLEDPDRDADRKVYLTEKIVPDGASVIVRGSATGSFAQAGYRGTNEGPSIRGTAAEPVVVTSALTPLSRGRAFAPVLMTAIAALAIAALVVVLVIASMRLDAIS